MTDDMLGANELPMIATCRCGRCDVRIQMTSTRAKYKRTTITCQSCGLGCVSSSRDGCGGSLEDAIRLWQAMRDLDDDSPTVERWPDLKAFLAATGNMSNATDEAIRRSTAFREWSKAQQQRG